MATRNGGRSPDRSRQAPASDIPTICASTKAEATQAYSTGWPSSLSTTGIDVLTTYWSTDPIEMPARAVTDGQK